MSAEWRLIDMTTCVPIFGRAHKSRHGVRMEEGARARHFRLCLCGTSGGCKTGRRWDEVVVGQQTNGRARAERLRWTRQQAAYQCHPVPSQP